MSRYLLSSLVRCALVLLVLAGVAGAQSAPSIDIRKQEEGPDKRAVRVGSDVTYLIVVTNTGSAPLFGVTVTDRRIPECDRFIGELAPGESVSYECTVENVVHSFTNEACVEGKYRGERVEDCDRSTVELIDIDIRKQAEGFDSRMFPFGSNVVFEIEVTNTGMTGLMDVVVTDVLSPDCDRVIGSMRPGAVVTYTCVVEDVMTSFVNEACVEGSRRGTTIDDCDPSEVVVEQICQLALDKQCVVLPPPVGEMCDDKIAATTLRYSGPSMNDVTVVIEGKDAGMVTYSNVDLVSGVTVLTDVGQNGFTIDARPADLGSETRITIDGVEEVIHTSCSAIYQAGAPAPLDEPKGDPSPNWFVVNFVESDGDFREEPPAPDPADLCQISTAEGVLCEQRPSELSVRFNGGDCSQSDNTQDSGKWDCSGDAGTGPVRIVARNDNDIYADVSDVAVGDVIDLLASAVGRDDLDSEIQFDILDDGGNLIQEIFFHTSCSQDLRIGDRFGSLEVVRFVNEEQGAVQSGGEVEYLYTVENTGTIDVFDLFVTDDPLGDIGGIASLSPGESATLSTTAFVDETITNIGAVVGQDANGVECSAMDSATVEILPPPPPPPGDCSDGKPTQLTFEYTGESCDATTNEQEGKVECAGDPAFAEPVQIVITRDTNEIEADPTDESIAVGGVFSIFRTNGDALKSETEFDIRQGGVTLQSLNIHTSCSKELNVGDQFGAVILRDFVPE